MKKNILFVVLIFLSSFLFAQTGSISVVSIPDEIEAGTTVDLQFSYTSNVAVDVTVQLFQTGENLLTPDYNTWVTATTLEDQPADTNAVITISFTVPGNLNPSSSLTNRQYTFDLKLTTVAGGNDFGWGNGSTDHTVIIQPSTVTVNKINFVTSPDANYTAGDTITFDFEYTLADICNVKAGLSVYTSAGAFVGNVNVDGNEAAQYFNEEPITTTTPVKKTASFVIPKNITPSALLESGNVFKVAITILTTSWGWITDKKADVTIEAAPIEVEDIINYSSDVEVELNQGDTINFEMEYTLKDVRDIKAQLAIYSKEGIFQSVATVNNVEVAQVFESIPATGITLVKKNVDLILPLGLTPTSELTNENVYRVEISINDLDGTMIKKMLSPLTVYALETNINEIVSTDFTVYPQPVIGNEVNITSKVSISSVVISNEAGLIIETDVLYNDNSVKINTISLDKGLYFVLVSTNLGDAVLKIIK